MTLEGGKTAKSCRLAAGVRDFAFILSTDRARREHGVKAGRVQRGNLGLRRIGGRKGNGPCREWLIINRTPAAGSNYIRLNSGLSKGTTK